MAFKQLEERLDPNFYDNYLEIFGGIKEPFHSTLKYMLDIAATLDEVKLGKEYVLYGGYGVLTHLADQFGERIIPTWRGSHDIDIIGTEKVAGTLKSFYNIQNGSKNHNVGGKRTLHIVGEDSECKVDLSLKNQKEYLEYREEKNLFGVPISVLNPYKIIRSKLNLYQEEPINKEGRLKHDIDILTLLGIIQLKNGTIGEVVEGLNLNMRADLLRILESGKGVTGNMRMNFGPKPEFRKLLTKYLKQHKVN